MPWRLSLPPDRWHPALGRWMAWLLVLVAALLLGGCASTLRVDSEVRSFRQPAALGTPWTFRFERVLSLTPAQQAELESISAPALAQAGLVRDDAAPRYSLRLEARTQPMISPYATPYFGFGPLRGSLWWPPGHPADPWRSYALRTPEPSWTRHEVTLTLRELASGQVAYETRAVSEAPWRSSPRILATLFSAALQGFPNPPEGVRQISIDMPLK